MYKTIKLVQTETYGMREWEALDFGARDAMAAARSVNTSGTRQVDAHMLQTV